MAEEVASCLWGEMAARERLADGCRDGGVTPGQDPHVATQDRQGRGAPPGLRRRLRHLQGPLHHGLPHLAQW
jgi:hypothetical protein